ncbi:MAG: hypothetical protein RLZZ461_954 [Planctomycetota bacterium]
MIEAEVGVRDLPTSEEHIVKNGCDVAGRLALVRRMAFGVLALAGTVLSPLMFAGGSQASQPVVADGAAAQTKSIQADRSDSLAKSSPELVMRVGQTGEIRIDAAAVRALELGDLVGISPLRTVSPEVFRVARVWDDQIGGRSMTLRSTDYADSLAVLVERKGWVCAWMQSPAFGGDFEWQFKPIGPGRLSASPRQGDLPGCGGLIASPMGPEQPAGEIARMGLAGDSTDCLGCSELNADVAFFYSSHLRLYIEQELEAAGEDPTGAHDEIAVVCLADAAVASTAMDNSGLLFGVRAVLVEEVPFSESGEGFLGRFAGQDDGDMDGIHQRRDDVFADACSLYTLTDGGGGYCGVAIRGNGENPGAAFNNVIWGCADSLVFAHEFGHNVGCCHAAGDGGGCDEATECVPWEPEAAGCCMPDATVFPEGGSTFNHGWRWIDTGEVPACRGTVMAYGKTIGGQGFLRIANFSNPEVEVNGYPTGSPEDDPDGRWADNSAVIRANMPGTTRFRCPIVSAPGEDGRLVPSGLNDADFFGISLASNGFDLAVGASRHDVSGPNAGAVFIFEDRIDDPDEGWFQLGKLTPSDLEGGERFGESVAMYDDLLVVGAPYASREIRDENDEVIDVLPLAGKVSVWKGTGDGGYCRIADLQPEDLRSNDTFGTSVALAGEFLVIGAPLRDTAGESLENAGAVWVYRLIDETFELVEVIEGEDGDLHGEAPNQQPGGRFGSAVGAAVQPNGDIMVLIGAPREGIDDRGSVYPFRYVEITDGWLAVAGDAEVGIWPSGAFGTSIAMDGEDVIVGAPEALDARGGAVVFRVDAEDLVETDQVRLNVFPGGTPRPGDRLGSSVAISSTHLAAGVPGRDFMVDNSGSQVELENLGLVISFRREIGTASWQPWQAFRPLDLRPGDGLGFSVGIVGYYLFAGAPEADDSGPISGVVYGLSLNEDTSEIVDCNDNGIDDSVDILITGESNDHNGNNIPDECEIGSCLADLNADGVVDGADMGILFVAWGDCPKNPDPDARCLGDFDGNGTVGGPDLGIFCASWGLECPPDKPGL